MSENDVPELYRKYRPTKLSQVVGQQEAVDIINGMGKRGDLPHVWLLSGPSGVGKTTIARVLRKKLKCSDQDFVEVNAADERGIELVRGIRRRTGLAPILGKTRVWLIDECHKLTSDAQSAFLKILEDTPQHVYFFLATTDPQKLKRTIITRCTEIRLRPVPAKELEGLVHLVHEQECAVGKLTDEVAGKIAEVASGSARKALVLLQQVIGEKDEEKQLELLEKADTAHQSIELCRLFLKPRASWAEATKILKGVDDEPEGIRRLILAYMTKVALGGGRPAGRAIVVIDVFRDHFYDCGFAGLVSACWEIITGNSD